jgi:hypothetical protein
MNDDISDSLWNIDVLLNNNIVETARDSIFNSVSSDVRNYVYNHINDSVANSVVDKLRTYEFNFKKYHKKIN